MEWLSRWQKRLRVLVRREEVESELDAEFALHLDLETEKNLRAGMSPEEARRQAVLTFGGRERFREEVRAARWVRPALELSPDMKLAVRMLVKHPGLSLAGGLGMALAVAVAAGFYTFMAAFYFSAPPLDEGERIVSLDYLRVTGENDDSGSTLFDYHSWRAGLRTATDVSAFRDARKEVEAQGVTSRVARVAEMTASGFRLARVSPVLGRTVLDEDEREGAPPVLVLGFDEWHRDFGGAANVLGREVQIDGVDHTIVGVMPEGFRFPSNHGHWTALRTDDASLSSPGNGPKLTVFARVAPAAQRGAVQEEASALHRRLAAEHPSEYAEHRAFVEPYILALLSLQSLSAWVMWLMQIFAVLVIIVIAVNVAVLVYARTAALQAELTVRTALGASRRRIVTQLFLEALALSAAAAAVGLLIAQLAYRALFRVLPLPIVPYWISRTALPASVILYSVGLAVLAAFVIGVIPGLQATGRRLQGSLRQLGGATGVRMGTTWTVMIVVQVAIAVAVLPSVIGIAWNTVWAPAEPSFPADEVLIVRLTPRPAPSPATRPGSLEERREPDEVQAAVHAELVRRLESEPGVAAVTFSSVRGGLWVASEPDGEVSDVGVVEVDVRYFEVLGLRLLAGRGFQPSDRAGSPSSVVLTRTLAQQVFGTADPVGRQVWVPADGAAPARSYQVVGVVENRFVRSRGRDPDDASMYLPATLNGGEQTLSVRVRGVTPLALLPRARQIALEIAPEQNFFGSPFNTAVRAGPAMIAFASLVVGLVTMSVLLLSAAGISGMMSFAVTCRQREIGIRSALGAPRWRIVWAIFARAGRQIALGLAGGAGGALVLDRLTGGSMLGGEGAVLPPLVAGLMLLTGLLATVGPARRALRVQPMEALRLE